MYIALSCLTLSVLLSLYCLFFPYSGEPALSPMLVPLIACAVLVAASARLVAEALKTKTPTQRRKLLVPLLMLGLVVLYSLLLGKLHFILLSALLLALLMYAFGERRPVYLAGFSLSVSGVVYLTFAYMLGVMLP